MNTKSSILWLLSLHSLKQITKHVLMAGKLTICLPCDIATECYVYICTS